jgi:hypothetical protein
MGGLGRNRFFRAIDQACGHADGGTAGRHVDGDDGLGAQSRSDARTRSPALRSLHPSLRVEVFRDRLGGPRQKIKIVLKPASRLTGPFQ